jgi:hypothetical protein
MSTEHFREGETKGGAPKEVLKYSTVPPSHMLCIGDSVVAAIQVELPKDWGGYVDAPLIKRGLDMLRKSVNRQSPYGTQVWQMEVSRELGLESPLRPCGRPRKTIGIEKGRKK